jgi:hypothetical protein
MPGRAKTNDGEAQCARPRNARETEAARFIRRNTGAHRATSAGAVSAH